MEVVNDWDGYVVGRVIIWKGLIVVKLLFLNEKIC